MAVGVAGNEDVARWVWNNHFAAVAGDAIGFEVIPPVPGGVKNFGTFASDYPAPSSPCAPNPDACRSVAPVFSVLFWPAHRGTLRPEGPVGKVCSAQEMDLLFDLGAPEYPREHWFATKRSGYILA
jgi:hypothetical protein